MKNDKKSVLKEKLKDILTNKKLLSIIFAFISYIYLCLINIIPVYNVFSWLLFACIVFSYMKTDFTCKKHIELRKEIIILTLFFSFLILYGSLLYDLKLDREVSILRILFSFKSLLSFFGIFTLIYFVLINIYPKLISYTVKYSDNKNKTKLVFFGCALIMLVCWLPYFLRCFPGALSADSFKELEIVINNFKTINDHHPVIHILFIALPYNIGYKLFGTRIAGVAFYSITQMTLLACMLSTSIVFLYKRRINKKILLLILLYYSLVPMHGLFSIVMWKDVIFSGLVLLLTIELIKVLEKEKNNNLTFKNMISFIIISVLCIFFRNNAIYMYFILIIFTLIIFKKHYKVFMLSFVIIIGVYVFVKGPIFNWLDIKKTSSVEYISMPLQQVGRMAYKDVKFTKKEKELINKLIPLKVMSEVYNPAASDYIKFNKAYNNKAFDDNKLDYFKLWIQLVRKHPSIAIEAYSLSTLGYWYPGVEYWSVEKGIYDNKLGIKTKNKSNKIITKYVDNIDSKTIPIVCMEWSIALCYWIILLLALVTRRIKDRKSLYVFIPVFGIWITMLIASPVFGEFRYVYGAFTSLPIFMVYPYLKLK